MQQMRCFRVLLTGKILNLVILCFRTYDIIWKNEVKIMKKTLYFILLAVEFFVGVIMLLPAVAAFTAIFIIGKKHF